MKKYYTLSFFFISILFTASAQYYDWRQTNSNLSALASLPGSDQVIFAGDQAGMIRKSTDQGATWKLISMDAESAIINICFLNATTGFASVNQNGLILYTQDGGATWERKQFMDATNPDMALNTSVKRIVRVDDQTAFFDIYRHSISVYSDKKAIVTRDGGQTFAQTDVPGNVFHVNGDTMVAFGRQTVSFIERFTVYRSLDKGMTWQVHHVNPSGFSNNDFGLHGMELAFFLNANVFYITANKTLAGEGKLFKTTDGGITFTAVNSPARQKYDYFYFKNSNDGFAVMSNGWTYFTSDGGTQWTRAAKDVGVPVIYLGNNKAMSQVRGASYLSADFGNNWTAQSEVLYPFSSSGSGTDLFLKAVNDSTYFASIGKTAPYTEGFNLMKTTNQGLTWSSVKDASGNLFTKKPYTFINADTFFFAGTGMKESYGGYLKIKYTTDGGLTHTDVFTGEYMEYLKDIVFIDKNNAVTYSEYAGTNYSTDGGMSWTKTIYSGVNTPVAYGQFPGINSWFLVSASGKVYKSVDQGANWTDITGTMSLNTSGADCVAGTVFLNESTGYIHGCDGRLYKTTDGGQNWTDMRNTIASDVIYNDNLSMAFHNESKGYMIDPIANGGRYVIRTTDAGTSWNYYGGVQGPVGILSAHLLNENTGAMLGTTGNFIIYTGNSKWETDTIKYNNVVSSVEAEAVMNGTQMILYPNPASEKLFISLTDHQEIRTVKLIDLSGHIVVSEEPGYSNEAALSLKGVKPGIYIVEAKTKNGIRRGKVLVR